jgi:hypothetical protein
VNYVGTKKTPGKEPLEYLGDGDTVCVGFFGTDQVSEDADEETASGGNGTPPPQHADEEEEEAREKAKPAAEDAAARSGMSSFFSVVILPPLNNVTPVKLADGANHVSFRGCCVCVCSHDISYVRIV